MSGIRPAAGDPKRLSVVLRPRRRLKVFQAQFGFYDTVVAAPSQAAALRAWGTRQNLFASGDARLATDQRAVAAALEQPDVPLRRPIGTDAQFEVDPADLPRLPDLPKPKACKARKTASTPSPPPPPRADRGELDAAEEALRQIDRRRRREEANLAREQEALDAKRSAALDAYVEARRHAKATISQAREAYRRAGGPD